MLKKVVLGVLVAVVVVAGGAWAFVQHMERQMDSTTLAQVFDQIPVPAEGLVLVDEWRHDGDWLIEPRSPEAVRQYQGAGSAEEMCAELDAFYDRVGLMTTAITRSDPPPEWCGRRIATDSGDVSVWVELLPEWRRVAPELVGRATLLEVTYRASR